MCGSLEKRGERGRIEERIEERREEREFCPACWAALNRLAIVMSANDRRSKKLIRRAEELGPRTADIL